jgi:hypothetical protein
MGITVSLCNNELTVMTAVDRYSMGSVFRRRAWAQEYSYHDACLDEQRMFKFGLALHR